MTAPTWQVESLYVLCTSTNTVRANTYISFRARFLAVDPFLRNPHTDRFKVFQKQTKRSPENVDVQTI